MMPEVYIEEPQVAIGFESLVLKNQFTFTGMYKRDLS